MSETEIRAEFSLNITGEIDPDRLEDFVSAIGGFANNLGIRLEIGKLEGQKDIGLLLKKDDVVSYFKDKGLSGGNAGRAWMVFVRTAFYGGEEIYYYPPDSSPWSVEQVSFDGINRYLENNKLCNLTNVGEFMEANALEYLEYFKSTQEN